MRHPRRLLPGLTLVLVLPSIAVAQEQEEGEMPQPARYENVEWYMISHIDFKAGHADEAMEIIEDHYMPAVQATDPEAAPRIFRHATGEWDLTVIFPMREGVRDLEWEMSPFQSEWVAEMARRAGGLEAAQELGRRYDETVARSKSNLVREHM